MNAYRLIYQSTGAPIDVLELVDFEPAQPKDGELLIRVLASPVNPMDLLMIRGMYPMRPSLPAVPGAEGVGEIVAVGSGAAGWAIGERVMLPVRLGAWQSHCIVECERVIRLPQDCDPVAASSLRVAGLSAVAMLDELALPGQSSLVQSCGGGAVGQYLAQLAKHRGHSMTSFVRRASTAKRLVESATVESDQVEIGYEKLAKRLREKNGRQPAAAAFDGVGGSVTEQLARGVADGATVFHYGAMSRVSPSVGVGDAIFRDIRLRGFWLLRWTKRVGPQRVASEICDLASMKINVAVAGRYDLKTQWKEALAMAASPDRFGRVVFTFGT